MTRTPPSPADWTPERIRALRKRLGHTQAAFAPLIGYKLGRSVSDLEGRGKDGEPRSRPSMAVAVALERLDVGDGDGPCARVVELWADPEAGPLAESARWRLRADWPDMAGALDELAGDA